MVHKYLSRKFIAFYRKIRPRLCADCKKKLDSTYHTHGDAIPRHRAAKMRHRVKHKLRAGIHFVNIRGKRRKVKVLASGKWRFMKG